MARLLIIEDDDDIREFVQLVLERAGHEVRVAENGRVALEMVGTFAPELILLDMRTPVMDGWAFMRAYRELPGPRARVIVMTAARDARDWAAQVAADGYIAKPFELKELLSAVANEVVG